MKTIDKDNMFQSIWDFPENIIDALKISEEIKKETQVWFELMKSNNVGMSINVLKPINRTPNTFSINLKLNII